MEDAVEKKKKDKSFLWLKITDTPSALEAAKAGVLGGGLMLAGFLFTLGLVYFSGNFAIFDAPDFQTFFIYQGVSVVLAALLTWRVYTGKGRFASIILLIWILLEVTVKLFAGQLSIGWGVAWAAGIISLVHSVRGSWWLHRLRKSEK